MSEAAQINHQVTIDLGNRSYFIHLGTQILANLGKWLTDLGISKSSPLLLITDENVQASGYLDQSLESISASGYQVYSAVIPAGERSKSLDTAAALYDTCIKSGLDRKSTILALGGGVVGDLAGFVAATYMRGIDFIGLPTTILAHDSSVGGKVAVNLPMGKNLVGSFHQPRAVLYDVSTLHSLPLRQRQSGLAEVVKHAFLSGGEFVSFLESNVQRILDCDEAAMVEALSRGLAVKAAIVSADERENNVRAYLNLGHTLGHAIEAVTEYGRFTHGEAISIGMNFAYMLSVSLGKVTDGIRKRAIHLLGSFGLPTQLPGDLDADQLIAKMYEDKKSVGRELTFVLPQDFGKVDIVKGIDPDHVRKLLKDQSLWSV